MVVEVDTTEGPIANLGLKYEWTSNLPDPHPLKISQCTTWLPETPSKDSASHHLTCSLQELHHSDVKTHQPLINDSLGWAYSLRCAHLRGKILETKETARVV